MFVVSFKRRAVIRSKTKHSCEFFIRVIPHTLFFRHLVTSQVKFFREEIPGGGVSQIPSNLLSSAYAYYVMFEDLSSRKISPYG